MNSQLCVAAVCRVVGRGTARWSFLDLPCSRPAQGGGFESRVRARDHKGVSRRRAGMHTHTSIRFVRPDLVNLLLLVLLSRARACHTHNSVPRAHHGGSGHALLHRRPGHARGRTAWSGRQTDLTLAMRADPAGVQRDSPPAPPPPQAVVEAEGADAEGQQQQRAPAEPPTPPRVLPVLDPVSDYEKICRIGEGTYGVVCEQGPGRGGELQSMPGHQSNAGGHAALCALVGGWVGGWVPVRVYACPHAG